VSQTVTEIDQILQACHSTFRRILSIANRGNIVARDSDISDPAASIAAEYRDIVDSGLR